MASRSINSVRERSLTSSRSSRSKTTAWLRPRALAAYIATSAQPSRSSPLCSPGSAMAMPILAVWRHFLAGDGDRLGDHVEHAIGRGEDLHLALGLVDDEDELVTAEARGEVVRADAGADPVGDRHEESVTAAVAQVVVHDLEPVEVDHHDGGLTLGVESGLQLLDQRPAVRQTGQFVVVGVEARALFGVDATLELHEHRGDGLEGVDLRRVPVVQVEVEEPEDAPRRVTEQERHRGTGGRRDAAALHRAVAVVVVHVLGTGQVRRAQVAQRHEDRVGVEGDLTEGVGVGDVVARRPLGLEDRQSPHEVVAADEGDVGLEEFGKDLTDPVEDLLAIRGRGRHEFFGHLSDQFVETTLVQQETLARRERRDVAEEDAEGLRERTLATGPRATVSRNDQGTDDVAVLDDDGVDEHAPLDAEHDARERAEGNLAGELQAHAFADAVEGALGVGADEWFEFEAGDRLREIRHYGDDLCTRHDLEERLDDQTGLFACAVQIRMVETSHGGSTFADR